MSPSPCANHRHAPEEHNIATDPAQKQPLGYFVTATAKLAKPGSSRRRWLLFLFGATSDPFKKMCPSPERGLMPESAESYAKR